MNDISPIGRSFAPGNGQTPRVSRDSGNSPVATRGTDRVEFSSAAQLLSRLHELPDVRQELIDRVRAEIASGQYETPDKIDAALDGLLEDLQD